ncbi:hypothetical protein HK097_004630 [Rhizophlyctis rosea]|uniref:F-box/LRR-repeat protein 15-like leucin rich repeat domain-containing protein n=1 Tax=Rhizophlyctis rosea TaxID=64517 RepID=A0AAD5S8M2_9FUNG|nr:hypothetical protein HK097_004630 [Rhizophlyctis rosea]
MSKCSVSDAGFISISRGCRRLHTLYASFLASSGPSDLGVQSVLSGCRDLKLLDVSRCERITDKAFLGGDGELGLQVLLVRVCGGVTFEGLKRVVGRCPRLQRLDCTGCLGVGVEERGRLRELVDERW